MHTAFRALRNVSILMTIAGALAGCAQQSADATLGLRPTLTASATSRSTGSTSYSVLYRFRGSDGSAPMGALIVDQSGTIFGTTSSGGKSGGGTVFSLTPGSNGYGFRSLYSFAKGSDPQAGVILVNGTLYGTTYAGGAHNLGSVYALSPSGANYRTVYSFAGGTDGQWPMAALTWNRGALYGTTYKGGIVNKCGRYGCGTIFRTTLQGTETVLHRFGGAYYGEYPTTKLLLGPNGVLFGTTISGGGLRGDWCLYQGYGSGCGSAFEMIPNGSGYTTKIIYRFEGPVFTDGHFPNSPLIKDEHGNLYGTTEHSYSESGGGGTVFELTPSGSGYAESVLVDFSNYVGVDFPTGQIVRLNGMIYGTALSNISGNVYAASSGPPTVLHGFTGGQDGANPYGGLTYASGAFYGTTEGSQMPSGDFGTVFRLTTASPR